MMVATDANARTTNAADKLGLNQALRCAFSGGAVMGFTTVGLGLFGLIILLAIMVNSDATDNEATQYVYAAENLASFGFGASSIALFARVAGGIYTKAADVGADLVGKVEQSIPEDDPRNPATIADLVGDMVGDCVGSSADVFESVAAEIIGAMILGSTLADEAKFGSTQAAKFVFFPLVVHAMDIIVSSIGIAFVGQKRDSADSDPWRQLQKGYR